MRNNLAAIRLVRALEAEQRPATTEEQQVLARWSGWGAVPKVFDERSNDLAPERAELLELLSPEEYEAAKANTLTAYYTDADLVQGIWTGMRELGFEGGNVLEPGCGSGNFIGFAPLDTALPTRMVGVEIDPTSAAIARHLYPDAQVLTESFAETIAPDGAFDSVIGNVPFDRHTLYDPRYNPSQESVHNHFILKSLQMTKPGGVVAVITSRWTLDSDEDRVRNRITSMADLVGAVRLPVNAHAAAAGTRTVTDVLFLRRREEDRPPAPVDWNRLIEIEGPEGVVKVNAYFVTHPEHVVGDLGVRMGRSGPEPTVTAPDGATVAERFDEAVQSITQRAREHGLTVPAPGTEWKPLELVGATDAGRNGLMEVDDGDQLTRIVDGVRIEIDPPVKKHAQELFSLLRIRDSYLELVEAERTLPVGDAHVEDLRRRLNDRYDAYVDRYGPINRFTYKSNGQRNYPRLGGIREDLMASRVLALEKFDPTTQQARKAEIFHKRTIAPAEPPDRAETAADALAISLDTYAEVRLEEIQRLMGVDTPEQARAALGTLVYTEPVTEDLIPAPQYLSGDVRTKLRAAQVAARTDERFAPNVEALRQVVPVNLTPAEIEARLGATWIDASYVQQFARELLDEPELKVQNGGGSYWTVSGGNPKSVLASHTWGTKKMPAQVILQNLLQNKAVKVTRTITDEDGRERIVLNQDATEEAQGKAEEMAEEFASWAWQDPDRARELARVYNDRFNCLSLCSYTGDHLTFPGLAREFRPFPHQRAAVARVLSEQASLLAHGVGAGKTAEMVISIMEMRRLGQSRKPAMVVPNHMLEQVSREFAELYPQAKILVADKDMMSRDYRQQFADIAASGDWDVVVFGHNQFKQLPLPNEERRAYEDKQIAEFEDWIASAETDPDVNPRTVKQLERAKVQLKNRYRKLWAQVDTGSATLADCGIDAIVYDEAHEAKNAMVRSNIQDAAKSKPSWQAEDLMMKADYIRRQGGKLVFATATPIANSVSEAYVVMRFLRPDLLHQAGIYDFDQWASTFGEIISEFEMKPEGGGYQQKDRFARFMNVPELLRAFHTFADVKLSSELGLDLPEVVRPVEQDGTTVWAQGRETVVVPPSEELLEYMQTLGERADKVRQGKPEERWSEAKQALRPDNMLWISADGRAAATDLRLVKEPAAQDTKIMHVADKVAQIWREHKDDVYYDEDTGEAEAHTGSLQMVFCDLGTPSDDPDKYDAYEDLREQLVSQGVPREQIRFVHEATNDKAKAELFASCRDGRTQVVVGSTKKMGTGTNMQRRAVALHHVDCPWRPVDIEQREGRLVRQRNANTRVRILSYVTEGSFDGYMWQTALRKLRFIEQIMRGRLDVREVEDVSNTAMSYAEIQALASGNPLMLERVVNEKRVKKLQRAYRSHHQGQAMLQRTIAAGEAEIANATAAIAVFDRALEQRVTTKGEAFRMVVGEVTYDKRTAAADALRQHLGEQVRAARADPMRLGTPFEIGRLGGFTLTGTIDRGLSGGLVTSLYLDVPTNNAWNHQYGISNSLAYTFGTVQELATSTGHGVIGSLENTLRQVENQRAEVLEAIPRIENEVAHARAGLGAPFARQAELEEALAEEARILSEMGLPPRESSVLIEGGASADVDVLGSAVDDAVAVGAIRSTAVGGTRTAAEESSAEAPAPTPVPPPAPVLASSDWRDEPDPEEVKDSPSSPSPKPSTSPESKPPVPAPAAEVVEAEEWRQQAGAAIGLFSLPQHRRAENNQQLREQMNEAFEALLAAGEHAMVADLVRRANRADPEFVITRETYRSRADVNDPQARRRMLADQPVLISDDLAPGSTGVVRHIRGENRAALREVLVEAGFQVDEDADEALLLNGAPGQRLWGWWKVMEELERIEYLAEGGYARITEDQWQELLRREQISPSDVTADPELVVEEPPQEEVGPSESTTPLEAGPEPGENAPAPEPSVQASAALETIDGTASGAADGSEELPQAPADPMQASDAPDAAARTALRRLQTGFDRRFLDEERGTLHHGIDYLVDAGMSDQALSLINDANRVDPSSAWGREEQRGRLVWRGAEAEQRALASPLIRIEHDGDRNTVVRGTDRDDAEMRRLLKEELKFRWSRRFQMWHLPRKLNAAEQRRRVSRLLTRLEEMGRDRIAESLWDEFQERERQRKQNQHEDVIASVRPGVEGLVSHTRQEGTYRNAIVSIDAIHQGLIRNGHVQLGDAPGTGDPLPFAEERTALVTEGREVTRQILERFNAILRSENPDLRAAWTLYEVLLVTAPPMDIPEQQLEQTRKVLEDRFAKAGLTLPVAAEAEAEAEHQEQPAVLEEQENAPQAPSPQESVPQREEVFEVADVEPSEPAQQAPPGPEGAKKSERQMSQAPPDPTAQVPEVEPSEELSGFQAEPPQTDRDPEKATDGDGVLAEASGEGTASEQQALATPENVSKAVEEARRMIVVRNMEHARQTGDYGTPLALISSLNEAFAAEHPSVFAERGPFAAEVEEMATAARNRMAQLTEEFEQAVAAGDRTAAQDMIAKMLRTAPTEELTEDDYNNLHGLYAQVDELLPVPDWPVAPMAEQAPAPQPADLYDDGPGNPYAEASEVPHSAPPLRGSISLAGVEPYPDRSGADRATWWISQNGVQRWQATTTAAELSRSQTLPPDDAIALDRALHDVGAQSPMRGGPAAAATRYADLAGAAGAVFERIDDDRQHLAQAAMLAAEHAARLAATREYNLARQHGARPAQLARLEARQEAPRYTGIEEAMAMSQDIATVVGRWARTTTARQMRESTAQGADVTRVRQMWEQVAQGGLAGGPGPAAMRFEGFSRAVGELNMRLEAETAPLKQLGAYATRHAARLAATHQALSAARESAPQSQAREYQIRPAQRLYRPEQDMEL
ncbi:MULTISPECIES: SNF2-related protein [unclassified Nocardiopsis]|uniref:SNF2-related protein n=1 Tax=unclassified Nocardiopsis TaxID=2649073 RepID=UPI00135C35D7|nr:MULTISPECIES: SNF2-related protein [unclassified Nocardiopsis]